jgi:hypothetical protein
MKSIRLRGFTAVIALVVGTMALSGCTWLFGPGFGLPDEFVDQVGEGTLDAVEQDLGVEINRGGSPPAFNSEYMASPYIMTATTVPNDFSFPGDQFADQYFRFYDQNESDQTINVQLAQGGSVGEGMGGYISGRFNRFTVFVIVDSVRSSDGAETQSLRVFSGKLESGGITEYQHALVMLDDGGNDGFIPNDTGRAFNDGDDFAARTTFPATNTVPATAPQRSDSALQ